MTRPTYVRSLIDGRMRLRHPVFATSKGLEQVYLTFKDEGKIFEIRAGQASILLLFDPSLEATTIWQRLEEALPALKDTPTSKSCDACKDIFGITSRQLGVRCLLGIATLTTLFGLVGSKQAHILAATTFLSLALRHIWVRRKAI